MLMCDAFKSIFIAEIISNEFYLCQVLSGAITIIFIVYLKMFIGKCYQQVKSIRLLTTILQQCVLNFEK